MAQNNPSKTGSSKSRGSQYALKMMCAKTPSFFSSPPMAMLCEVDDQSGWLSFTPCQACLDSRSTWVRLIRRRSCSTSRKTRRSISNLTNRRHVRVLRKQIPVEPARLIVLAIGVVVATLTAPHLVTHEEHRHAHRKHTCHEEVLNLPVAQFLYRRIVRRAFKAAVPASILLASIVVVFAVFFVVLVIVSG